MEKLDYDSSKLSAFHSIYRDLRNSPQEYNITKRSILNILDSKHRDTIIKDYPAYRTYLKMHVAEENGIKNLDEQITQGIFNPEEHNKIYGLKKTAGYSFMREFIDIDKMAPHSSDESNAILSLLNDKLSPVKLKDKSNYRENLVKIYNSTTKDNVEARSAYLNTYMQGHRIDEYRPDEMDNIAKLFNKMDEDPNTMKFIKDISVPNSNITGAGEFIKVIDNTTPERRNLYAQNISYIMSQGIKKPAEKAIKFCNINPGTQQKKVAKGMKNFVTGLFSKKNLSREEHKIQRRAMRRMYKQIDIPENETLGSIESSLADKKSIKNNATANLPAVIYHHPKLDLSKPAYTAPVLPKLADITGGKNRFKFNVSIPVVTEKAVQEPKVIKKGIFVNRTAKQPSAKKLQVISDVNNLIEKKLGKNVLADQAKSYERSATKMRLGMLPDIFASIKETRAQKRAAGTFSKHKSESNADALTLYQMIKGRNKRLVNYMLKVRNEDGTRMYSVKDIISTVGETEKGIRMAKNAATKEAPFTAADAKSIYTTMLDEQVSQHGKLPRAKKK